MLNRRFYTSILIFCFLGICDGFSAVDPPNYDFSLDRLQLFSPGKAFDLKSFDPKIYGKGELLKRDGKIEMYRFYVSQLRYKFPVFVQVFNFNNKKTVLDFYARLPAYFLHDVFHRSMINRYGKQERYYKIEDNAIYVWKPKDNIKRTYSGTCSITCFPIFYTAKMEVLPKEAKAFKSLLETFVRAPVL